MKLRPIRQAEAKAFVKEQHRHNPPPLGSVFQVAVEDDNGILVGVAIAGRPVARHLDDGRTLEVVRLCTDGSRNVCSMLYGACRRAAIALGYAPERVFTYTLESEPGSSLLASGWVLDAVLSARPGWDTPSRRRDGAVTDGQAKKRWRAG